MTAFEFLSVALSFVLGLAVTSLLSSVLVVFKARKQVHFDWLPVAWAGAVFVLQVQYWWALFALRDVSRWTLPIFVLLLLLALILFGAGGLILPTSIDEAQGDLREFFRNEGRWGVLALLPYYVVGLFANVLLWGQPLVSSTHGIVMIMMFSIAAVFFAKDRRVQATASAVFGLLLISLLVFRNIYAY
jgi:hypothetical protein